jgi:hypothetical protein
LGISASLFSCSRSAQQPSGLRTFLRINVELETNESTAALPEQACLGQYVPTAGDVRFQQRDLRLNELSSIDLARRAKDRGEKSRIFVQNDRKGSMGMAQTWAVDVEASADCVKAMNA